MCVVSNRWKNKDLSNDKCAKMLLAAAENLLKSLHAFACDMSVTTDTLLLQFFLFIINILFFENDMPILLPSQPPFFLATQR
jgi:hypothetical protein